eukprot:scaffold187469_cov70-Cyclotella_meneghiniana.AAC.1
MMTANRWECVVSPLVSSKPYLPVRLTMPRHASLASNRIERESKPTEHSTMTIRGSCRRLDFGGE